MLWLNDYWLYLHKLWFWRLFIFSIFVHLLNCVFLTNTQIEVIQKLLLDFLWKGKARLKMTTIMPPPSQGGLKMLHVKNVLHVLHVKWMKCLSTDLGLSWSRFIWPEIVTIYPPELYGGMRQVLESDLCVLPNFYAGVILSYCWVNDLFYKNNKNLSLSHNVWATWKAPEVNKRWVSVGLCTLNDLARQAQLVWNNWNCWSNA